MSANLSSVQSQPLPVALYLMPGCGICYQVKGFLERHEVPVELRWITEPANQAWVDAYVAEHGRAQAPLLLVGDEVLQGYQPDPMRELLSRAGYDLSKSAKAPAATVRDHIELPEEALWVTNFLDGSISFVDPSTLQTVAESVPLGAESNPVAVAFDKDTDVVAVSDMGRHCVVFFDYRKRTYLRGNLQDSTLATPRQLGDIVLDPKRHRFYVGSVGASALLAIDSTTGQFVNGTAERSSVPIGTFAGGVLLDEVNDRVYVRTSAGCVAIDLERFASLRGELELSTLPVGSGRNLAFNPALGLLYAGSSDDRLYYVDAARFDFAFGDPVASSVETERSPFGMGADPDAGLVFTTCVGTNRLLAFDASEPRPSRCAPLDVRSATRTIALLDDHVLAVSSFDDGSVCLVDSRTNTFLHDTFEASRIAVGEGPRGMAYVGSGQ